MVKWAWGMVMPLAEDSWKAAQESWCAFFRPYFVSFLTSLCSVGLLGAVGKKQRPKEGHQRPKEAKAMLFQRALIVGLCKRRGSGSWGLREGWVLGQGGRLSAHGPNPADY